MERGGLISLAILALYLWLAPGHIVDGDNAEFATLGSVGGVSHPSGYPLYLLWLRATSWLAADPAHAAALATAILGGIHAFALHAACRAWGARPSAASVAVAMFATVPITLRMYTEAEVFALNGLIVSLILLLSAPQGPLRGRRRVVVLALVAGLGLANHLTCALVAPVGIAGVVVGMREHREGRALTAIAGIVAFGAGLLPYAYLLATPETLVSWGTLHGLGDLVGHFLRLDYGGPGQLSPHGTQVSAGAHLTALIHTLGRGWWWVGLAGGLGTLAMMIATERGAARWAWAMLALAFVLAGPLFVSRFNIEPEGIGLFITQRFHILPSLLLAVPVAVGLDRLLRRVQQGSDARLVRSAAVALVVPLLCLIAGTSFSLPYVQRMHTAAVERGLENTLRSLPVGAVVIVQTDLMHFGFGYLQATRGERLDVTVIMWAQVPSPQYRARIARIANLDLATSAAGARSVDVAEKIFASGRPLFVDAYGANIARAFPSYPFGVLFRALPPSSPLPSIQELYRMNLALFEHFALDYSQPGLDDDHATQLHAQYARLWDTLARALPPGEEQRVAHDFSVALAPK
jgi:hypothetical protein